jgi:hypothetical protein
MNSSSCEKELTKRKENGNLQQMAKRRKKYVPRFKTYDEAADWFDTHSLADYETTEVRFDVHPDVQIVHIKSLDDVKRSNDEIILKVGAKHS